MSHKTKQVSYNNLMWKFLSRKLWYQDERAHFLKIWNQFIDVNSCTSGIYEGIFLPNYDININFPSEQRDKDPMSYGPYVLAEGNRQ